MKFDNTKGNLVFWNALSKPPKDALKTIKGGRLQGMTDVNPQWRYEAMTEVFGPVGVGWKYEIVRLWDYPLPSGEVMAFAQINVFIRQDMDEEWSAPIPGVGGSSLVSQEKSGLHSSDEGYKMAITDALSVALKTIGVAAEIYRGRFDGSKYKETAETPLKNAPEGPSQARSETLPAEPIDSPPTTGFHCHAGLIKEFYEVVKKAGAGEPEMRRVIQALVPEKCVEGKVLFSKFTSDEYDRVSRAFESEDWKKYNTFKDDVLF